MRKWKRAWKDEGTTRDGEKERMIKTERKERKREEETREAEKKKKRKK